MAGGPGSPPAADGAVVPARELPGAGLARVAQVQGNTFANPEWNDAWMACHVVASSKMFQYNKAEEVMAVAMMIASTENLPMLRAVGVVSRQYDIIEGRPSMKAQAMLARFQDDGGTYEIIQKDKNGCIIQFEHPAYARGKPYVQKFMFADATSSGLAMAKAGSVKNNWAMSTEQMCFSRAVSWGLRTVRPGIVLGMYTPEELEDMRDERRQGTGGNAADPLGVAPKAEPITVTVEQPAAAPAAAPAPSAPMPKSAQPRKARTAKPAAQPDPREEQARKDAEAAALRQSAPAEQTGTYSPDPEGEIVDAEYDEPGATASAPTQGEEFVDDPTRDMASPSFVAVVQAIAATLRAGWTEVELLKIVSGYPDLTQSQVDDLREWAEFKIEQLHTGELDWKSTPLGREGNAPPPENMFTGNAVVRLRERAAKLGVSDVEIDEAFPLKGVPRSWLFAGNQLVGAIEFAARTKQPEAAPAKAAPAPAPAAAPAQAQQALPGSDAPPVNRNRSRLGL